MINNIIIIAVQNIYWWLFGQFPVNHSYHCNIEVIILIVQFLKLGTEKLLIFSLHDFGIH